MASINDSNFGDRCIELFQELSTKKIMILATSCNDIVTARSMSVIIYDNKIYFQTDEKSEKAKQIETNQMVALAIDSYQIEGRASVIGKWKQNPLILKEYIKEHISSYEKYKDLKTEIVYEIVIDKVKKWEYVNGEPFLNRFDFIKNTFAREKISCK